MLCKVPGLRRGKELVLACWENTARIYKKINKNPEECASHHFQACSLWFWEQLAALAISKAKADTNPSTPEWRETWVLIHCEIPFILPSFPLIKNKHLAKFRPVAGFCFAWGLKNLWMRMWLHPLAQQPLPPAQCCSTRHIIVQQHEDMCPAGS